MKILLWVRNAVLIAALGILPIPTFAQVAIGISITTAPPLLPVYVQPVCPAPNYIWTPGYWAWGPYGYYWVPGTWVMAPAVGLLWTPGYWGWSDGTYAWNAGYWGPEVGFYGGVDYGFGYSGVGFYGGRWSGGVFSYNTAVMRVNTTVIHNTYIDRTVIVNRNVTRVSYNGGRGGIQTRPTQTQMAARQQRRMGPVAAQTRQVSLARGNRENYAAVNKGLPPHAALQRPATSAADFDRAVPARGARPVSELRPAAARLQPVNLSREVRPTARAATPTHSETRPEARPTESRPAPSARPENRSTTTARPAPKPEAHPVTTSRPETRPTSTPRSESRPEPSHEAAPESRPAPRPAAPARTETRPEPAPRAESRPAPRPEAAPESRPAPRPAAPARTEARPESRPAPKPEQHLEARPQAKPEAQPREEKPHGI